MEYKERRRIQPLNYYFIDPTQNILSTCGVLKRAWSSSSGEVVMEKNFRDNKRK